MPVLSFTTGNCARSGVVTPRFTGGTANGWKRNPIVNRLRWGSNYASVPSGWREGALILPFKDGAIRLRLEGSSAFAVPVTGYGELGMTLSGSSTYEVPGLGLTGLRDIELSLSGSSALSVSLAAFGNLAISMRVGELSQQDVEGAVLEATVEGDLSLKEVLRILLAVAAGKTSIAGTNVAFRDQADTKNRVAAEMTGSQRTTINLDPS